MGSIDQQQTLPMTERYVVRTAKTKKELDDILEVIWAANYTPYEPFVQLFFPILGFTPAHRAAAVAESKERFWSQHQGDCSSNWFYIFDTVTGRTVGCAQWVISELNPFAAGTPRLTAPWWPEGECRKFCESILNQVYRPRASWMTRPHCGKWSLMAFLRNLDHPRTPYASACDVAQEHTAVRGTDADHSSQLDGGAS